MRALAIVAATAAVLVLTSGGRFILVPLLFLPLGVLSVRRVRKHAAVLARPMRVRRRIG
jgi:hypothetical protein